MSAGTADGLGSGTISRILRTNLVPETKSAHESFQHVTAVLPQTKKTPEETVEGRSQDGLLSTAESSARVPSLYVYVVAESLRPREKRRWVWRLISGLAEGSRGSIGFVGN